MRKKIKTVRAKKKLGQHFLKDINIAKSISETLTFENYNTVLEIGPGMGTLTDFLIPMTDDLNLIEIDKEAVVSLVNLKASRPEQAASQRVPTLRLFSHLGTSNSFPQLRYYTTRKEGVTCRVSITMPFIYYGTW